MRVELPLEELAAARDALPAGGKKLTGIAVYVAIAELAAAGLEATNESIAERAGASNATVYNYLEPLAGSGVVLVEKPPRGLLSDLGVTPAQIAAREGAA